VALALLIMMAGSFVEAQQPEFDLLIRQGHVIDPRNSVDGVRDVAISNGKIAAVAEKIAPERARRVVDAAGLYVTPGLIDLHAHVFFGTEDDAYLSNGPTAAPPDHHSFRSGQTTMVDAGGAGWRNFPLFKTQIIDKSRTRVLSFINIVGSGMRGGPVEQDLNDMSAALTRMRIEQFRDLIVGIKVAHYAGPGWEPVDRAVEAGRETNVPVMVDFGGHTPPLSLADLLLKHLRPGDILTHMYAHVRGRHPIVEADGRLQPFVVEARKRGVIFDVGHGGGSFLYRQAVPATKAGFFPDVISTDLHTGSMNSGMKDILNTMSKFLNLGMPLNAVIGSNTARAADAIKRPDLGHLGVGAEADVAVLSLLKGNFGFIDSGGGKLPGTQKLQCELTVKAGQVVWDLNGRAALLWSDIPASDPNAARPPKR
jgi:dihydroorotase